MEVVEHYFFSFMIVSHAEYQLDNLAVVVRFNRFRGGDSSAMSAQRVDSNDKAEVLSSEPRNICCKLIQPHAAYPPILMSASWSAGTSLKLNGETSLHKPKALAMPRRVSLAFIKFVGKESNLLRNSSNMSLILVSTHIHLQKRNLPKYNGYCSDRSEFPQALQLQLYYGDLFSYTSDNFRLIRVLLISVQYWSAGTIHCKNKRDGDIIFLTPKQLKFGFLFALLSP